MGNEELLKQVEAKAQVWLGEGYDEETKAAVRAMLDNEDKTDLIEAFYKDLEFGTGGLRGIMGAGTNRMNIYTVGAATQGLSNYLKKAFADLPQIKVAIGHDCRNNSRRFAEVAADVFSANGIKVYLFDALRPTPEVSFAIRELGCQSGVSTNRIFGGLGIDTAKYPSKNIRFAGCHGYISFQSAVMWRPVSSYQHRHG